MLLPTTSQLPTAKSRAIKLLPRTRNNNLNNKGSNHETTVNPNNKTARHNNMTNLPKTKYWSLLCRSLCPYLFAMGIMSGCGNSTIMLHSYHSFSHEEWKMQDTIDFNIVTTDSLIDYTLTIEIRNNNYYPYQNLPVSIICTGGGGLLLHADTISLNLADEHGSWKGKGTGGLYQTGHYAGMLRIGHTDSLHHIRIAHLLPDSILKGISDIGIRLEQTNAYRDQHQHAGK